MKREESRFAESTLMEGMISFRAVVAGIEAGISDRKIERVLFDRQREKKLAGHLSYIRAMAERWRFPLIPAAREEIDALAIGTSHGGILTFTTPRTLPSLTEKALVPGGFYVLLGGIEDPYNFGYALRSLYAAGADGAVLLPRSWMSAAGVVCRASAGASERMPLYLAGSDREAADIFRAAGYRLVCADLPHSRPLKEANLKKPLLLAVGGEKRGLSASLLSLADEIVRIDYGREFREALSAASAATILAVSVLSQNGG